MAAVGIMQDAGRHLDGRRRRRWKKACISSSIIYVDATENDHVSQCTTITTDQDQNHNHS